MTSPRCRCSSAGSTGTVQREQFHIGRRHVRNDAGDVVVVDWRADVSLAFYRATAGEPMDVSMRRRFGHAGGALTSLEDERLTAGEEHAAAESGILTAEIERPRVGPMRDIVATIAPDQDTLVRAPLEQTMCVQGAPGTGKTAVGLHRAAYLLYTHREQLRRTRVLVVGPNRSFLSYIGALLPALGEIDVQQVVVDDLVTGVTVRSHEPPDVARLKGDARLAAVVERAVHAGVRLPTEPLVVLARVAAMAGVGRRARRPAVPRTADRQPVRRGALSAPDPGRRDGTAAGRGARRLTRRPVGDTGGALDAGARLRRRALAGRGGPAAGGSAAQRRAVPRPLRRRHPRPRASNGCCAGTTAPASPGRSRWSRVGCLPDRRGGGARVTAAVVRARRRRRGAGPLGDAVPGARPALRDRVGHRARRHRAGDRTRRGGELAGHVAASRQA